MKYLLTLFGDESGWGERTPEQQAESMKAWDDYTQEVTAAGAFLGGEGLQPSATATTVKLDAQGGAPTVTDGPFAETKELIAGFWLWKCQSKDEAIAWVKRCPTVPGVETNIEIRQIFEAEDFGAEFTPEARAQEERLRQQIEGKK